MAAHTDARLQNQVIYSVYVRAHTPEGTFNAVANDLFRIRALGVDIIWFMPIHPIGVQGKKGSLGCPYACRDYRSVNPAYGTLADFKHLCDFIHDTGMKVMIDVVYNHAAPDCVLWEQHPEYFYKRPDGRPGNRVADWTDVIDLDYGASGLWDYQIETLRQWAALVDGFRCDVASLVPLAFWKRARAEVEKVHPGFIWLAETVHREFGAFCRSEGLNAMRDTEAYEAFDIEYDYDLRTVFERVLRGEAPLSHWTDLLEFQEAVYPENYNKLRFLENHDVPRIASLVKDEGALVNYTAMLYFLKGTTLLYAGQEWADEHLPSLFEREPIDRETGRNLTPLLQTLFAIKRGDFDVNDQFFARADDEKRVAVMRRSGRTADKYGVFSLAGRPADAAVDAPDGVYVNRIDGSRLTVSQGRLHSDGKPIIFRVEK